MSFAWFYLFIIATESLARLEGYAYGTHSSETRIGSLKPQPKLQQVPQSSYKLVAPSFPTTSSGRNAEWSPPEANVTAPRLAATTTDDSTEISEEVGTLCHKRKCEPRRWRDQNVGLGEALDYGSFCGVL